MEIREILKQRKDANEKFRKMYEERLIEICSECGLFGVDVVANGEKTGRITVEKKDFSNDYEIVFHHYTKKGDLSKNASYTGCYIWSIDSDDDIKNKLLETFKVAN